MSYKMAFVFPGQGSQFAGMLDVFAHDYPQLVSDICDEASTVLGYDIAKLIAEEPAEKLNQTEYTQPALLTASFIAWQIWQKTCEERPIFLAGHSLGEYSALVCSGALSFADGLKLVAQRGALMQAAVPVGTGAMAAILGLSVDQVKQLCDETSEVAVANINAPGQIVIAGTTKPLEQALDTAKNMGAKRAIMLPVSVPSHCFLMRSAAEKFANYLNAVVWHRPKITVIHNYDVMSYNDAGSICKALEQQLYSPVRWVETIEFLARQGLDEIFECGPGKVLTGLNRRIVPTLKLRAITDSLGVELC